MSDVAEVKEAIECLEKKWCGLDFCTHSDRVVDAARRWVRVVEGLDYEAAYDELGHIEPSRVKQAVDAAVGVEKR